MYCHKCGSKSLEGAIFCQKCGAKLIKDEAETQALVESIIEPVSVPAETPSPLAEPISTAVQESVMSKPSAPSSEGTAEVCDLLKEGLSHCPKIKSVSPAKKSNAIIMKGMVYNYIANIVNGRIVLIRTIAMPFIIPLAIIVGFLAWIVASISWNFMDYGFDENYILPLAIGLLAIGLFLAVITFLGEREAGTVLPYIRKAIEPEELLVPTIEKQKRSYIITLTAMLAIALIGIVMLVFVVADNFEFSSSGAPYVATDNTVLSTAESVSLNQTYTNEEEGFSFDYPSTWQQLNENDFEARKDMDSSLILEIYALNDLGSERDYYASHMQVFKMPVNLTFQGTKEDFQNSLSLTMNEVEVTELVDIDLNGIPVRKLCYLFNDNGQTCVVTEYYYTIADDMYGIRFYASEKNFGKHEPIFNAIMDSYTITAANTSDQNVPFVSDIYVDVLNEYITYINDATYTNCEFVLYDIDGNGVDELLVRYDDMMDGYTIVYTYANGTPNKIGEFWSRNRLLLDEEGNFYIIGSNSASNSILELARVSPDGTALVTIEAWEMNGPIYTHITTQNGSEVISESEYQAVSDQFYNTTTEFVDSLNWQPLSAVATSETPDNFAFAGADNGAKNTYEGQVLYNEQPIANLLSIETEKLYDIFGTPISGTPVDGSLLYGGTEYCSYDGISFTIDSFGYIDSITGDASLMTINETTLDKDRAGIIEIFGEPILEEEVPGYENEVIADHYVMQYILNEYIILSIKFPDINSKATSVSIAWCEGSP